MMTLEEAIKLLKQYQGYDPMFPDGETLKHAFDLTDETVDTLLTALRPVSREQVEKVFPGCEKCRNQANWPSWIEKGFVYCPKCGTPLTSWAWEKQVERLEALYD
mgnify:CR=1 FL=1